MVESRIRDLDEDRPSGDGSAPSMPPLLSRADEIEGVTISNCYRRPISLRARFDRFLSPRRHSVSGHLSPRAALTAR